MLQLCFSLLRWLSVGQFGPVQSVLAGVPHAPALLRLEGGVKACVSILVHHSDKAKVVRTPAVPAVSLRGQVALLALVSCCTTT